nr:MAG TPA: hypothetical protein [Caudoviricetes sp.]
MATKMITRTFRTQSVHVMTMDTTTNATEAKSITLPHVYTDNDKLLKEAKKRIDTDTIKAVYIVGSEVKEELRGVDEEKFLEMSVPVTRGKQD